MPVHQTRAHRPPKSARKQAPERPVRVYILTGLAIGLGIVLAYWLYWSAPLGLR